MTTLDETRGVTVSQMPQLVVDHDDPRIRHSLWCQEHTNEDPIGSPAYGVCTAPVELDFHEAAQGTDDSAFVSATLEFAASNLEFGYPGDIVYVAFNRSGHNPQALLPWKCVPLAFALLAANARSRGDEETANSFARVAQSAIDHHDGDKISHRMEVVDRSRYSAEHREGMMAAYRELGRHDLIAALLEDMDWIDRRSPDEPPSMNRSSVLPTTRTAPDGTVLDLTQPLIDRLGQPWHWVGYSTTGTPLVSSSEDGGTYTLISAVYDSVGPFTQDAPAVSK